MIRPDLLLLGYRTIRVPAERTAEAASALLSSGISAAIGDDGRFPVSLFRGARVRAALGDIPISLSPVRGLVGVFLSLWRHPGALSALLLSLFVWVFTSDFVWDVRVEREDVDPSFSTAALTEELRGAGLYAGARWSLTDRDAVEAALLSSSQTVGWVSITRTGRVAYVKMRGRTPAEPVDRVAESAGYANIVAAFDCVIEEITVTRGYAAVEAGDTVQAGDLLISGVLPAEAGGGFCRAEGVVLGRMTESVSASCDRVFREKIYGGERLCALCLEIFNFPVNILKNSRNSAENCVIIEETIVLTLPGDVPLPCRIRIARALPYTCSEEKRHTDEELVRITAARLAAEQIRRFSDADLLRLSTVGEFTESGYRMQTTAQVLREVGRAAAFGGGS